MNKNVNFQKQAILNDIALIRNLDGTDGDIAVVAGPEVHGSFWFDVNDTTSDDDNRTVIVDHNGGRWKLNVLDADAIEYQPGSASAYRDGSVGAALAQLEQASSEDEEAIATLNAAVFSSGGLEDTVQAIQNEIDSSGGLRDSVDALLTFMATVLSSLGALAVGYVLNITGAVSRSIGLKASDTVSLFDFMTSTQIADVQAGTLLVDVTTAVQTAIDNARGHRILAPKGRYKISAPLVVNSVVGGSATPFQLVGEGFDANGTGANGTSFCNSSGTTDVFQLVNTGGTDTSMVLEDFGIFGLGGSVATAGCGVNIDNLSNVKLKRLWVQGHGNAGVFFNQSYGSGIEDSIVFKNRLYGIWSNQAFNDGNIKRCKVFANGYVWSQTTANILINGSGNPNLGVTIDGTTDVSYAGSGIPWYAVTPTGINVALTSIVVAGGVATATTPAAHGRATNDKAFITGATTASSLNSVFPATITVANSTQFTFATSAPDGTYTDSTLRIAPYSVGLLVTSTTGLTVSLYSEDCAGPAMYIGSDVTSFAVTGGYWQGNNGSGLVVLDACTNGRLSAMQMAGINAGIYGGQNVTQHNVNIESSITLANGAVNTPSMVFMIDGRYFSGAMPTTGSWTKATIVWNNAPAISSTPGWIRLTTGSGNVLNTDWRAMPVL